jgi:transposase
LPTGATTATRFAVNFFFFFGGGGNNIPVIPDRENRKKEIVYDKRIYRKRGLIERIFGKLKENRRLTLRYEKSDMNFLGFIIITFIKIFL